MPKIKVIFNINLVKIIKFLLLLTECEKEFKFFVNINKYLTHFLSIKLLNYLLNTLSILLDN
jgi:hypothetical protein